MADAVSTTPLLRLDSTAGVRRRAEAAIDLLLALLDDLDGDPDLEDDDLEAIDEREPDHGDLCCWPEDGDQTTLASGIPGYSLPRKLAART